MPNQRCFRAVDREQSAERPERLAAQILFACWSTTMTRFQASAIPVATTSLASPPPSTIASASAGPSVLPPSAFRFRNRTARRGQRQTALAGGRAATGNPRLFQFGTVRVVKCSAGATLDLNLVRSASHGWTKSQSRNTVATVLHN